MRAILVRRGLRGTGSAPATRKQARRLLTRAAHGQRPGKPERRPATPVSSAAASQGQRLRGTSSEERQQGAGAGTVGAGLLPAPGARGQPNYYGSLPRRALVYRLNVNFSLSPE